MEDNKQKAINYYEVLGISKTANENEIKKAFYKMSLKYHPDKHPDDKESLEKFHEVQQAYKVLQDPSKRYIYDEFGTKSRKEINEECEEVDEKDEGELTIEAIVSAMKAMGMSVNEQEAEHILANTNFEVNDRTVRKGGLRDELIRSEKEGVTSIDLSKLVIRSIKEDCVEHMKQLTSINFSTNSIRSLPDSFGTLTQIKKLNLSDNKFTEIPACVFKLKNLEIFEMERNEITEVTDEIFQLENLRRLNLFSNKIRNVPIRLCFDLKKIQSIDISCNNIHEYPQGKEGIDLITDADIKTGAQQGSLVAQYFASLDKKPRQKKEKIEKRQEKKRSKK
ncbi:DnaJ family protein [Entamoeba histolytica HM-1:IMSS-B]|uniref:DnaJ family protein n=6 Tax=Entamoeba histolytica TaxID=5759 RepID=C4LTZ6_ENTH1|nr:DnaJ family protein [Entamoeba histolytica HM-1:IMSS]EMD46898.1 DnaJ family protein [Entamoeba histolytica KU27]EMH77374.1 DnaJ family protein [Entamoeba histolytica HM-1:IMSS-B]EMS14262.1 DnaJ family protein [Entamoeba histolytica HM-3:IMSS]ENY65838.1 DnaJ family protein, putative [Entamoeba histolytica HM-1:IMSS-A]GAT92059.1 DNAj family protein [Entamoeba histolytica]|eukprot:XP_656769.1 DnaJ family protein [Entamoeba histolytica HM-1:IMSS]